MFGTIPPARISNLTVKQMRAFVAAAECKSFTEAAQRLHLTQSAFSRSIKELESSVGEVVFMRTTKGLLLTLAGEVLLPYADRVLRCYAEAAAGLQNWRYAQNGKLVLAGSKSVMSQVLPSLLTELSSEFGFASIEVEDCASEEVIEKVRTEKVAFGFATPLDCENDLQYQPLLRAQMGLLAAKGCAVPEVIGSLDDLRGVPLVRYGDDALITKILRAQAIHFDAYFDSTVVVSNSLAAKLLLLQAGVYAMVATGLVATKVDANAHVFAPLPGILPTLDISLISKRDKPFDPHLEVLKQLVRNTLSTFEWHESVQRLG